MRNVRCSPVSVPETNILGMAVRSVVAPVLRMNQRCQAINFRDPIHKNGYTLNKDNIVVHPIQYLSPTCSTMLLFAINYCSVMFRLQFLAIFRELARLSTYTAYVVTYSEWLKF